jgi:tetratricopeptide (TPR) repeat protein
MKTMAIRHRIAVTVAALVAFAFAGAPAWGQSLGELNSELGSIESQMGSAESSDQAGVQVVERLDKAEALFAKIASSPKTDKAALMPAYQQLDSMLSRLYTTYKKKKDDCIAQIDSGGQCDYDQPEQVELRALYPLSWLRFQGATTIYSAEAEQSRRLLNQAIDGFTESTLAMVDPNLVRENTLGRAYCERELGKFDKSEYDRAIADFKKIMEDGSGTAQYKAAQQGLATTYAAMGKAQEAAKYGANVGTGPGATMFHLQTLFTAENATHDPAQRAQYHKQIIDVAKSNEDNKQDWGVVVAAVSKYSQNPVAEFGSGDAFEKWLLAEVLLGRKDLSGAAKYYIEAARGSGKYNKGYKYAADIYAQQKRYDMVEQLIGEIARQPGNPDAQWAEYERFKMPYDQWAQSGMKNAQLEDQWVKAAQDYLNKYPKGQYQAEARFRIGERLQRQGKFLEAAQTYAQVTGENDFSYTAKFKGALCNYQALVNASSKDNKQKIDVDALRKATMDGLNETIRMEPGVERNTPAADRKFIHDTRGEATYDLVKLLEQQPKIDDAQVASLLQGFEREYPSMGDKFHDVAEWRIAALDRMAKYDVVEKDLKDIVERNKNNLQANDFMKELGLDFWKAATMARAANDQKGYVENAKLTSIAYSYHADMVAANKIPAKNLTGTLSILGKAYLAMGEEPKAEAIFEQVVKADPASPDANAGLARIAQAKKNWKDALTLWTNVENTAAESDDLWYEAKYNLAVVYSEEGNTQGACSKLAQTRAEHPTLGKPEMKAQWDSLQRKLCLDHK